MDPCSSSWSLPFLFCGSRSVGKNREAELTAPREEPHVRRSQMTCMFRAKEVRFTYT
jgi:hypothetical protein